MKPRKIISMGTAETVSVKTEEIIREINSQEFTSGEILAIFDALHMQKNLVGGRIWTTNDVYRAVKASLSGMRFGSMEEYLQVCIKAVETFEITPELADAMDCETDWEKESLTDEADEAVIMALESMHETEGIEDELGD